MDITNQDDIDQVVKTIEKETHGVDILVNCAGFGMYGAMEDTTLADARYQFEVNLFGMAYLTQKVLPSMRKKCRVELSIFHQWVGKFIHHLVAGIMRVNMLLKVGLTVYV